MMMKDATASSQQHQNCPSSTAICRTLYSIVIVGIFEILNEIQNLCLYTATNLLPASSRG
jgi:hypothetical protein